MRFPDKNILGVDREDDLHWFHWARVAISKAQELSFDRAERGEVGLDGPRIHDLSAWEPKGLKVMPPAVDLITRREIRGDHLFIAEESSANFNNIVSEINARSLVSIVLEDIAEDERVSPEEIFHLIFQLMNLLCHGKRSGRGGRDLL
jgi:hypothetical protein